MIVEKFLTHSPEETFSFGEQLAASLHPGDIVGLTGGLGSGKTCLIRGICRGLGIEEDLVVSPTFILINQYEGRFLVYHFDFYRIGHQAELLNLGLEDYLDGSGVCLIEWTDRIRDYLLPLNWIEINLTTIEPSTREVAIVYHKKPL